MAPAAPPGIKRLTVVSTDRSHEGASNSATHVRRFVVVRWQ
jgi:hypothetical protein